MFCKMFIVKKEGTFSAPQNYCNYFFKPRGKASIFDIYNSLVFINVTFETFIKMVSYANRNRSQNSKMATLTLDVTPPCRRFSEFDGG